MIGDELRLRYIEEQTKAGKNAAFLDDKYDIT
jgi:hypothetical protein